MAYVSGVALAHLTRMVRGAHAAVSSAASDAVSVLVGPLAGPGFVLADVMPNAVFERVGPTEERYFAPSTDLTTHLFGPATPGWILVDFKAHLAGGGYASAEAALWDPRGSDGPSLVAYATQQMFFTPYDPG